VAQDDERVIRPRERGSAEQEPRKREGTKCLHGRQHDTHLWLFFDPSFSSSATVAGNGEMRCTGPFAMSAVVWPLRATAVTSAPCATRYSIISLSPRAAAWCSGV